MADVVTIQTSRGPFTVARAHADRFKAFLEDPEWGDYTFDPKQSGGYNNRNIDPRFTGGRIVPSQHAFGNAIDINWTRNARGTPGDINPDLARKLAQKHGLKWGGDWSNPDPMHFEIADAGSPPVGQRGITNFAGLTGLGSKPAAPTTETRVAGATYTRPGTSMTPYNGMSPEQVEFWQKRAEYEPMRHNAGPLGALAEGLRGLSAANSANLAERGRREGRANLMQALAGGGDTKATIAALLANPWAGDAGMKLLASQLGRQMEFESPQGQQTYQTGAEALRHAKKANPVAEEQAETALAQAKRKAAIQEAMMGDWGFALPSTTGAGPTPLAAAPATPASPVAPADLGDPSRPAISPLPGGPASLALQRAKDGAANPGVIVPAAVSAQPAAPPAAASIGTPQAPNIPNIKALLATRSKAEAQAWLGQYFTGNAEKAWEKLYEWAEPNKKQEESRQKERGEHQARYQAALPGIVSASDTALKNIDDVLYQEDPKNPGKYLPDPKNPSKFAPNPELAGGVGWRAGNMPDWLKAPETHDIQEKLKQIGGAAFLQAYESLKGAGSITENEIKPATSALGRLANLRQSEPGYRKALMDFRNEIIRLRQLAYDRAEGKVPMPYEAPPRTPQTARDIPDNARAALKANPNRAAEFDAKYGTPTNPNPSRAILGL